MPNMAMYRNTPRGRQHVVAVLQSDEVTVNLSRLRAAEARLSELRKAARPGASPGAELDRASAEVNRAQADYNAAVRRRMNTRRSSSLAAPADEAPTQPLGKEPDPEPQPELHLEPELDPEPESQPQPRPGRAESSFGPIPATAELLEVERQRRLAAAQPEPQPEPEPEPQPGPKVARVSWDQAAQQSQSRGSPFRTKSVGSGLGDLLFDEPEPEPEPHRPEPEPEPETSRAESPALPSIPSAGSAGSADDAVPREVIDLTEDTPARALAIDDSATLGEMATHLSVSFSASRVAAKLQQESLDGADQHMQAGRQHAAAEPSEFEAALACFEAGLRTLGRCTQRGTKLMEMEASFEKEISRTRQLQQEEAGRLKQQRLDAAAAQAVAAGNSRRVRRTWGQWLGAAREKASAARRSAQDDQPSPPTNQAVSRLRLRFEPESVTGTRNKPGERVVVRGGRGAKVVKETRRQTASAIAKGQKAHERGEFGDAMSAYAAAEDLLGGHAGISRRGARTEPQSGTPRLRDLLSPQAEPSAKQKPRTAARPQTKRKKKRRRRAATKDREAPGCCSGICGLGEAADDAWAAGGGECGTAACSLVMLGAACVALSYSVRGL